MNEHDPIRLLLYLDNELDEEEHRLFAAHLAGCAGCQAALQHEQRLNRMLHSLTPQFTASTAFKADFARQLQQVRHSLLLTRRRLVMLVAVLILVIGGAITLYREPLSSPPPSRHSSTFSHRAVDVHQRYLRKQLPLEVVSPVPETVSAWFVDKVSFSLRLPGYPETPGQPPPYDIVGGRLLHDVGAEKAAYVAYRLRQRPISLLITAASTVQPTGGEVIPWEGLHFHFEIINGWNVLTWSDQGLTYALVSDLEKQGRDSCIVCHPGAQKQPFLIP